MAEVEQKVSELLRATAENGSESRLSAQDLAAAPEEIVAEYEEDTRKIRARKMMQAPLGACFLAGLGMGLISEGKAVVRDLKLDWKPLGREVIEKLRAGRRARRRIRS